MLIQNVTALQVIADVISLERQLLSIDNGSYFD
jgi:hypothetical protein